jgi:hypothetical protein
MTETTYLLMHWRGNWGLLVEVPSCEDPSINVYICKIPWVENLDDNSAVQEAIHYVMNKIETSTVLMIEYPRSFPGKLLAFHIHRGEQPIPILEIERDEVFSEINNEVEDFQEFKNQMSRVIHRLWPEWIAIAFAETQHHIEES